MTTEAASETRFEIGHVLFIDIVGYSKLLLEEQKERLHALCEIVLATAQVIKAQNEQLVTLPTGDGMALVFRNSSEEPAQCALEIARALKEHPEIQLRMGIHSGPVSEVGDVTGRRNIAGPGINIAQRVMNCGDPGHILVSERVAGDLGQYRQWRASLHDLGECDVKHNLRLHLFNLHTEAGGNAAVPEKLRKRRKSKAVIGRSRRRVSSPPVPHWRLAATLGMIMLLSLALLWWLLRSPNSKESSLAAATPFATPLAPIPEKSIAVLPFENLSSDKENVYFAEGVQDEILTKLASITDLKVISRASTQNYQAKPDNLNRVSQELGVATVLEGTVQRASDKVRVNVQLIDARADSHLWARSFDGDAKDIFAVESKVAQEVADSLRAKLSPAEVNKLASAPTNNPAAYDLFLKGDYEARVAQSSLSNQSWNQAASWYQQAINRDPTFALATARLVEARMLRHWFIEPFNESELPEIKRMAERALALQPNLPEAHIALGTVYYYGYRQYEQALAEFSRAVQLRPNNSQALEYMGYVHRRQGKLELALEELTKALEQNPRDAALAGNRADIYIQRREWLEAQPPLKAAIALDPHNVLSMRGLLLTILNGSGDIQEGLKVLATYPPDSKLIVNSTIGDITGVTGDGAYTYVLAREYPAALRTWENATTTSQAEECRQLAARAAIRVIAGDFAGAQMVAEKAKPILEQRLSDQPGDILTHTELSWVYLALKRNVDARKLTQQSAALLPPEKDLLVGYHILAGEAMIAGQSGAGSEAVDILRHLLAVPAGQAASICRLRIDPVWDPIRNVPAFQQLLAGKELVGPKR
jgi:TolB-like protein/class 3 adenylate cyclase/regulator of sirC expression with transglutaminase-like and TPR domain